MIPWAEAGILDVDANNDVVKALGKKTFAQVLKNGKKVLKSPLFQLMAGHKWWFIGRPF